MALSIFDLDNTLIAGDSDYAWGEFLVEEGVVDGEFYQQRNAHFYQQYQQGELDIQEYLAFALAPLAEHSMAALNEMHTQFMTQKIQHMLLPKAHELVLEHQARGDQCLVITSTNSFVAAPICKRLGIDEFIASEPEIVDGAYTGRVAGTPSFREGKITRLSQWLDNHQVTLTGSYAYSDSINDLPLLEAVANPVVVDGDQMLQAHALEQGWPCISLRD